MFFDGFEGFLMFFWMVLKVFCFLFLMVLKVF